MGYAQLRCMDCIWCVNIDDHNMGTCLKVHNSVWCLSLACSKFIGKEEIF